MSEMTRRKMRFYLVLPGIVLPFVTLAFWLLDGGKSNGHAVARNAGLNTRLPDAHNGKDSAKDKLAFYELADADSAKRSEARKNDPYAVSEKTVEKADISETEVAVDNAKNWRNDFRLPVYENRERTQQPNENPKQVVPAKTYEPDPELEAINNTLEKLAALQHPAKPADTRVTSAAHAVPVQAAPSDETNFFGRRSGAKPANRFLTEDKVTPEERSFSATIPSAQVLQSGSIVKLQLNQSLSVSGKLVPSGAHLFGVAALENERLLVHISSVRVEDQVFTVALSVYDLDGLEGIYVPGSLSRDVLKSTAEQSLQSVNVLSLDPSIKTQAAMAGIGAVKNLLSKKAKAVRVSVAAGYQLLLRENTYQ